MSPYFRGLYLDIGARSPSMEHWLAQRAMALRYVETGRRIVDQQRDRIARDKALGVDTDTAEGLLGTLVRSQLMFEEALADLDRREPLE